MFPQSLEDYSLEKLSKTDGFKIYPPVNTDFKFETLPDLPNYVDGNDYSPHPNPSGLHMIPGDFDNIPEITDDVIIKDKRTRKYYINGPPKKKKKRKAYNLDFTGTPMLRIPTQEQIARRFGVPHQPFEFQTRDKERDDFLKPSEHERLIMDQFKNKKRKSKFDDSTPGDSIITNNSLVPNLNRFDFSELSNRPHPRPILNDNYDWKVREAANNILSKHNLPKI
jgi:hypothetical protein